MLERLIRNQINLDSYGESVGWKANIEALDSGVANPTDELLDLLLEAMDKEGLVIASSLYASNSSKDWFEQREVTVEHFQKLYKYQREGWLVLSDLYGEERTFNQYLLHLDSLSSEEALKESKKNEATSVVGSFRYSKVLDIDLLVEFFKWCIDIGYFSGHLFLIAQTENLIIYPYYFENGLGIISYSDAGDDKVSMIVDSFKSLKQYKIIKKN